MGEMKMQAATIKQTFGPNMAKRWVVALDADAAEIMGETRLRYVYESKLGAERFAATLQANLDASFADAIACECPRCGLTSGHGHPCA